MPLPCAAEIFIENGLETENPHIIFPLSQALTICRCKSLRSGFMQKFHAALMGMTDCEVKNNSNADSRACNGKAE